MLLHREERIDESSVPTRDKELHVTVDSTKPNSVGLKLEISGEKIIIANQKGVEAYYHSDTLRQAFEKKYEKLIYVLAEHKKEQTSELLWYNEAFLLHGFDSKRFLAFVGDGLVKLDLRLGHYEDGRPHDHGTCFRVLPKYLPQCFESVQKIL